ncbi:MAG: alanine--tRNA ligase [Bacteroidetes bacterium 4484_249]|nr:MAG: alanine--tRNA ligase [Bacteroidetes bacterium 4484_249]
MDSKQTRQTFFDFFKSKQHKIVESAPMVVKDDPTLMFTNAGMNQFKDIFLGNASPAALRVANTQKCLRVSGKHNDLDEVGHDTYHHTMFEMMGNWSFGDYFKKEAINWGWELLTEVYKIDKDNLYVTVFGGDKKDGLSEDMEAYDFWKKYVPEERILFGSKKDNFWEMGETGPCGPCSEIHIDVRDEQDKKKIKGSELVNKDHPEVIEIWNLVFIEFNRKSDGSLHPLPAKHVDTGMGFERLCMVIQGKKSNYDTDIFQDIISETGNISKHKYGDEENVDIAMRVIADHLRAIVFAIADGQLPSNIKAGYVIRRILRRAVRYGYTFLGLQEPFINELVPVLVEKMGDIFPEIKQQQELIKKVITEEEISFLRTLSLGIKKFEQYISSNKDKKVVDGAFAFELFDTFGFPVDLTQVMAKEKGLDVDMAGFNRGLEEQKNRSRQAAVKDTEDWIILKEGVEKTEFVGYESLEVETEIVRYRKIKEKKKEFYQIVLDKTPFYAESGGQVGDKGYLENGDQKTHIENTQKENELIIHITKELPAVLNGKFYAVVDKTKRLLTANNHSATHLMHAALRKILGSHVEQKGSLVDENHLRFDFSHFSKLTDEEISEIESIVNEKIRENIPLIEKRNVAMDDALKMGAVALFGEKYGDTVRVITFNKDFSVELCGGTHVPATGQIGFFKIISESAIAAGIRRIEAITAVKAEEFINENIKIVNDLKIIFKSQKNVVKGVQALIDHNNELQKEINILNKEKASGVKSSLLNNIEKIGDINFIAKKVDLDANNIKDLAFKLKNEVDNLFLVLGSEQKGKATLTIIISDNLVKEKDLNAGNIIREISKEIQGGGGGQPHFATAGGKNPGGLEKAFKKAREIAERHS